MSYYREYICQGCGGGIIWGFGFPSRDHFENKLVNECGCDDYFPKHSNRIPDGCLIIWDEF